ncbi:spike base protein, RCAP_Rcc01079 family [Ruegeria atlantica]|uniref:spike base protein, RCAP_Rcc01079 family n=1 Tax=Ruegeria atlantica TaxID=81569 RepID=UPI0024949B36|nr:hypothetical protein [Ruegeria atlantica]
MADDFADLRAGLDSPQEHHAAVFPSDTVDLPNATRALWVGNGGNITATTIFGETEVYENVPSGTLLPGRFTRIHATGNSASSILALW